MTNIIDSVVLTPAAVFAWREAVAKAIQFWRQAGVQGEPGIEEAYEQPDGSLHITATFGSERLTLSLPPSEWSHAN